MIFAVAPLTLTLTVLALVRALLRAVTQISPVSQAIRRKPFSCMRDTHTRVRTIIDTYDEDVAHVMLLLLLSSSAFLSVNYILPGLEGTERHKHTHQQI